MKKKIKAFRSFKIDVSDFITPNLKNVRIVKNSASELKTQIQRNLVRRLIPKVFDKQTRLLMSLPILSNKFSAQGRSSFIRRKRKSAYGKTLFEMQKLFLLIKKRKKVSKEIVFKQKVRRGIDKSFGIQLLFNNYNLSSRLLSFGKSNTNIDSKIYSEFYKLIENPPQNVPDLSSFRVEQGGDTDILDIPAVFTRFTGSQFHTDLRIFQFKVMETFSGSIIFPYKNSLTKLHAHINLRRIKQLLIFF